MVFNSISKLTLVVVFALLSQQGAAVTLPIVKVSYNESSTQYSERFYDVYIQRQQCASTLSTAEVGCIHVPPCVSSNPSFSKALANTLQDHWWTGSGYTNGITWTDAVCSF
jgi:hypothetical protein